MAREVNSTLSTLRIAALGVVLLASGAFAADRPNIVYLLAADLGARDLGFRGGTVRTPTLDAMAAGGAILNAFYVQPYSSQTRAALLTGMSPWNHGMLGYGQVAERYPVEMPRLLHETAEGPLRVRASCV